MRPRLLTVLVLAAGCGGRGAPVVAVDHGALSANAPTSDEIVATVDGRPIRASDVAAQAKAADVTPARALDQLIDTEVLAGVAAERGLLQDSDVVEARKRAAARRLLETDFEKRFTVDQVPDSEQRRAYELNKIRYDHPDAVEAWHVVAIGPASDPVQHQKARTAMLALEPLAHQATTDEAFAALAERGYPGVQFKAETMTFPKRGVVEDAFADAAFKLDKPGDVSPVTETSYGFHLIRMVRKLPEQHVAIDAVRPELRAAVFPVWRKVELDHYLRALSTQWSVQVFPDRLAAAEGGAQAP